MLLQAPSKAHFERKRQSRRGHLATAQMAHRRGYKPGTEYSDRHPVAAFDPQSRT